MAGIARHLSDMLAVGGAHPTELRMQLSDAEIGVMKGIKKALDPNNIMNPGKIFG